MDKTLKIQLENIINLNEIDPLTGVAIGTGIAQGVGAAGYGVYRRYMSGAAKACRGLEPRSRKECIKKYHQKAGRAKLQQQK